MIFLTGGTGYVGQRLLGRLTARGEKVRCLVMPGDPVDLAERFPVEVVRGDLLDPAPLEKAGAGVTAVVHGAALMLPNPPERIRAVNVGGTANLLRVARAWGVRRFVHISAVSAVYSTMNSYGRSKAEAERLVRESGAYTLATLLPSSFVSPEAILGLSQNADLDFGAFRDECGYQPVTLDVGLRKAFGRA